VGVVPLLKFKITKGNHNMTTSTKVYSGPSFDFEGYNAIVAKAPAGMHLFLAQQSLEKVAYQMSNPRFKNPLAKEVYDLVDEIASLRESYKKEAALRDNRGPAEITIGQETNSGDAGQVA
jgi:hypothetical protein